MVPEAIKAQPLPALTRLWEQAEATEAFTAFPFS